MSRTLSMNCGSGDSLTASVWCGLSANARQIRLTAVWLMPVARAIERVDVTLRHIAGDCLARYDENPAARGSRGQAVKHPELGNVPRGEHAGDAAGRNV